MRPLVLRSDHLKTQRERLFEKLFFDSVEHLVSTTEHSAGGTLGPLQTLKLVAANRGTVPGPLIG